MEHIKSPQSYEMGGKKVFLAGTIEMGKASLWQDQVAAEFSDLPVMILNPRRDEWDSSWSHNSDEFNEQVVWELDGQDHADHIFMYFEAKSKSPITLLELGLYAQTGKLIVVCSPGYWRYGNVRFVCERFNIPLFGGLQQGLSGLRKEIGLG